MRLWKSILLVSVLAAFDPAQRNRHFFGFRIGGSEHEKSSADPEPHGPL